jgi:uncharacterized flavoprotein (TIGR03862 family)
MREGGVAVVGGGPAGLIAADVLSEAGCEVDLFDAMPSLGRKLLVAGVGGFNLTHSEDLAAFAARYGAAAPRFSRWLARFGPAELRAYCEGLGIGTRIGSSGRVFSLDGKAAPLLRAIVRRLRERGVRTHTRHRLVDVRPGPALTVRRADSVTFEIRARAVILALGGASWGRLGSDGLWSVLLAKHGVALAPFAPSNAGFEVAWSPRFRSLAAGKPLKNVVLRGASREVRGELLITDYGLEGGAIYALSRELRAELAAAGKARIAIDLRPGMDVATIAARLAAPRGKRTLAAHFRRVLGDPLLYPLLREVAAADELADAARAAQRLRGCEIELRGIRPLDEAISSAGGVALRGVDERLELAALPGVHVAGEMLDYDPPTGGYLLQAAFTTGYLAAKGVLDRLAGAAGEG